jgi:hypothetical protein
MAALPFLVAWGGVISKLIVEPNMEGVRDALGDAVAIRGGAPVRRNLHFQSEDCAGLMVSALAEATRGDGLALANHLETCVDHTLEPAYLFAVIPTVTHHREELAAALRNWPLSIGNTVFDQVHAFAIKRDLARLLGDSNEATRLQTIIDRHAKVFADRDRITALFLDEFDLTHLPKAPPAAATTF